MAKKQKKLDVIGLGCALAHLIKKNHIMKHGILIFYLIAVFCYLPATGIAADKGTVTIAVVFDIYSTSPYKSKATADSTTSVQRSIFQAPTRYDTATGKHVPDLAESVEPINNNMSVKITLRKDARFHNGYPVTSEDAKFSWQQFMDKKNPNMVRGRVKYWKDIEIIDDKTFIIHYKQPVADWYLAVLAFQIGSKKYYDEAGEKKFHSHPIGSGPFRFVSREIGEKIVLEAVENHPQYKPAVKKLVFKVVSDEVTRLAMLEAGEADFIYGISPHDAVRLKRNKKIRVKEALVPSYYGIGCHTFAHPDLLDKPLRQAMLYAVDRQQIVDKIFLGAAYPLYTYSSVSEFGHDPNFKIPYDPKKAKELLKKSSYKPGTPLTLTYAQRFANGSQVFEAIHFYFKAVGINIKLKKIEFGTKVAMFRSNDPKIQLGSWVWHGVEDPGSRLLYSLKTNGILTIGHSREDLDKLIDEQSKTFDEAKRLALLAEIRKIVFEDPVHIPLFGTKWLYATSDKIDYTWVNGSPQMYNLVEMKIFK